MQKLDDILLKKGDIVDYYSNVNDDYSSVIITYYQITSKHFQELNECKIIKVQRPIKFETIYEVPKPILDKKEKEYLEAVIMPFRDRVRFVVKFQSCDDEIVEVELKNKDKLCFPKFPKDTMYKGMELDKEYTLEELGLFKE